MREISTEELSVILDKHSKWLANEAGGKRANLRSANLCSADLFDADLRSADLRHADLRSANLRHADLRSADLRHANLRSADLFDADLRSADLRSANLCSANLCSANLRDADLRDADLRSTTGQYFITQRTDGYQFFLVLDKNGRWYIRAGCQYKTIKQYREHTKSYSEESKRVETNLILDFAEVKLNSVTEQKEEAA